MTDSVPAAYAQAAIRLVRRPREEVVGLLADLGLPESLCGRERVEGSLDAEQFGRLFMALVLRAQDQIHPDPRASQSVRALSTYRLMYTWMIQAGTLAEAVDRAALFYRRFDESARGFSLSGDDPVEWRFEFTQDAGAPVRIEHFGMGRLDWLPGLPGRISALFMWHRLASWMTGHLIDLEAVHVDLPRRGSASRYEPFRAPVLFGRPHCALVLRRRFLALPVIRGEPELNRMLATFPAELLRVDAMAASVRARVRALLGEDFRRELPGLEDIAKRLNMASATLHRRLQAEGTSYQRIKDECRRDRAIWLLRAGKLNGEQIAVELGFSDASTFLRAFKKWTGRTPAGFRESERA